MSDNFFSRWSRRKQALAAGQPVSEPHAESAQIQAPPAAAPSSPTTPAAPSAPADAAPLPTLQDAQALTPASDFQPFMQRGVDAQVRNAAMKKLFTDPHFNVMDGLDIYIDDYNQPDPLPAGMLRRMASAQFMKLVPDEAPARQPDAAQALAPSAGLPPLDQVVAQSPDSSATPPHHDHPDLQLQPDPAPEQGQPGPSPR